MPTRVHLFSRFKGDYGFPPSESRTRKTFGDFQTQIIYSFYLLRAIVEAGRYITFFACAARSHTQGSAVGCQRFAEPELPCQNATRIIEAEAPTKHFCQMRNASFLQPVRGPRIIEYAKFHRSHRNCCSA